MELNSSLPQLLDGAGITQEEFGELCGVRRATVNMWCRGKMRPHQYIRSNVLDAMDRVGKAVSAGALPLPRSVQRKDRREAIRQATN